MSASQVGTYSSSSTGSCSIDSKSHWIKTVLKSQQNSSTVMYNQIWLFCSSWISNNVSKSSLVVIAQPTVILELNTSRKYLVTWPDMGMWECREAVTCSRHCQCRVCFSHLRTIPTYKYLRNTRSFTHLPPYMTTCVLGEFCTATFAMYDFWFLSCFIILENARGH